MDKPTERTVNLLVTLDEHYLFCLNVMLCSLLKHNPGSFFRVYLLQTSIREEQLGPTRQVLGDRGELVSLRMDAAGLEDAPTT
ncbi:MAG: hypothetical protein LUF80_04990, partial [Oscillospiraceae bacterium]|nr:hypothetical protein [Oscillospiraceae bacterium]